MRPARRSAILALALAALVGVGIALSPAAALARLRALLYSPWFPLALAGLYAVRPVLAWPITALSALVGYRYGLALGVPIALAGAAATSLIPYVAARRFRPDAGVLGRVTDGSERFFDAAGGFRGVVAARLAPTPAEPVSAAAGAARVPVPAFVLGTLIGEFPWTVAAVLAGHSMHRLSLADAGPDPWLIVGGAVAGALLIAGPAYRYVRGRAAG